MFEGIRNLIDIRLGGEIVKDHFDSDYGAFIKIEPSKLFEVIYFLKDDPDTRLNLLEQILLIKKDFTVWQNTEESHEDKNELLYQISSIKLPYRVMICIDIAQKPVQSIKSIHKSAAFWQKDLGFHHQIIFEEHQILGKFNKNKFL